VGGAACPVFDPVGFCGGGFPGVTRGVEWESLAPPSWLGFLGSSWLSFPAGVSPVAGFSRFLSFYRVFSSFFPVLVVPWVVPFGQLVGCWFAPGLFVGSSIDVLLV